MAKTKNANEDLVTPVTPTSEATHKAHPTTDTEIPEKVARFRKAIKILVEGGNDFTTFLAEALPYSSYATAVSDSNEVLTILTRAHNGK